MKFRRIPLQRQYPAIIALAAGLCAVIQAQIPAASLPARVPPKRSSQIHAGFGINSDLPREPFLPWQEWWWTRMFDAGVNWIRIGQYENSSDPTSWDWVEQQRGVYAVAPEVDDYVNSLAENGVNIQVQLMYGNPMYTSASGKRPDRISPEPGSFHNDDRSLYSVFWPPTTPEQIDAFVRYVTWMVTHFKGRIHYYALWNEEDIGYWNPIGNPEAYGRLLKAVAPAIHKADPQAKVIYGAQAEPVSDWAKRALDACQCAAEIDVFAYHTYPGYGQNLNPETMDYGAYGLESTVKLRETVRNFPGIRKEIEFWDDEFNSIPSWVGSDETVQTKYLPRGMLYNLASGVRTFLWLLAAGVDGNEYDDFGFIHGKRNLPDDFTPRPVYYAIQNTNALFSDTVLDPTIGVAADAVPVAEEQEKAPFLKYGFRNVNGKAIVAYWLAAHSVPGGAFPPLAVDLTLSNTGIRQPVLIDVDSGAITPLRWKAGTSNILQGIPLSDSVQAIADASYFDWPVLPEAPSGLAAQRESPQRESAGIKLRWIAHGNTSGIAIERRAGNEGPWLRISKTTGAEFIDREAARNSLYCYRVRALNADGESAYSNVVRVEP